ncbi:hypothetical protein ACHAO7_009411 [Fusarium culmorum]
MAHLQQRKLDLWSIPKDPFPEATTPMSVVARYFLASVLFIIQLTLMVGVPATPSLLACSIRDQLWLALVDAGKEEKPDEVLGCLIVDTILLAFFIWGAVPVFAMARIHGKGAKTSAYVAFSGMLAVYLGLSMRAMYLARNWALLFKEDAGLAGRCSLVTWVLCALLCSCLVSIVGSSFYVARFGTPTFIQQMLHDTTKLLCPALHAEKGMSGAAIKGGSA